MALSRIGKFQNTELLWPQCSFRSGLSTVRFGRRNAPIPQKSPGQTRSGVLLCHANNLGPPPGEGERSGGEWLKALDLLPAFFSSGNTGRRKGQCHPASNPVTVLLQFGEHSKDKRPVPSRCELRCRSSSSPSKAKTIYPFARWCETGTIEADNPNP